MDRRPRRRIAQHQRTRTRLRPRQPGREARGTRQHALLPGPNSCWSEAAAAGGIRRRLVGPIWLRGVMVTDLWIGRPEDPPAETRADLIRALVLVGLTAAVATAIAVALLLIVIS